MLAGRLSAQTFTTLHHFTGGDGSGSYGDLILSGSVLYGTTSDGGPSGLGTVFAMNTNGTAFTNLHGFAAGAYWNNSPAFTFTNSDGARPTAGLVLSSGKLYGTTDSGGISGSGTIFAMNADGSGFTNLYVFSATTPVSPQTNDDGANPSGGRLVLVGNTFYGTATFGGHTGGGTVFAINTDGTGFTNLHNFVSQGYPSSGLILSGNTLYGTSSGGGDFGAGAVFAINTDGTGFTNLYSFTSPVYAFPLYTNIDGAYPQCVLVFSSNRLYGTTPQCGAADKGTVFSVNIDGTGFTNLHNFSPTISYTNSDGQRPDAGLILSGNTLYGTTEYGGSAGNGVVYAVNTDGTSFTTLHPFSTTAPTSPHTNSDGGGAYAGLILSGNTLYGTTYYGGATGNGTIFSLSLPAPSAPQLDIISSGANVILTWPAELAGYNLQSAPTSSGTFTNIPGATSPYTNLITEPQQFFRLSQ